jgi:hypothetical protein
VSNQELLAKLLNAAEEHGQESDTDHEVGDLRTILETCWKVMNPVQQIMVYNEHSDLVTDWGKP